MAAQKRILTWANTCAKCLVRHKVSQPKQCIEREKERDKKIDKKRENHLNVTAASNINISHMDFIHSLRASIVARLNENKIGSRPKKTLQIAQDIFWVMIEHHISDSDLLAITTKAREQPFMMREGNLWQHLSDYFGNAKYVAFLKDIAELTPSGLNTSPNACCGKFELLYRLLRPNSSQPAKGDILDGNEKAEIKGKTDDGGVRISSTELTGKDYKQKCDVVFKNTGIKPNIIKAGGLKHTEAYEIEKKQYNDHYTQEFERDIPYAKELHRHYLNINGWRCDQADIDKIFKNDRWHQDELQRFILKKLFIDYKLKNEFDKMYIFGDGTNVKIIESEDDLSKLKITSDYFRINQAANVGWYIV